MREIDDKDLDNVAGGFVNQNPTDGGGGIPGDNDLTENDPGNSSSGSNTGGADNVGGGGAGTQGGYSDIRQP